MKNINHFIQEKLIINKNTSLYTCQPKNIHELRNILEERLSKDRDDNLNDIDVSQIEDMSYLFSGLDPHNIDISDWDVYKVRDMSRMFNGCKELNCDLSKWDVSNVKNMREMFNFCNKFKGEGLENWDVSKVKKNETYV